MSVEVTPQGPDLQHVSISLNLEEAHEYIQAILGLMKDKYRIGEIVCLLLFTATFVTLSATGEEEEEDVDLTALMPLLQTITSNTFQYHSWALREALNQAAGVETTETVQ